jgi:hypothetical protein
MTSPSRTKPTPSAKNVSGHFDDFVTRLLAVPHSEIKQRLEAEREAKRTPKAAFRDSGASKP